jgi:uncharacterized membrane protein YhdT
MSYPVPYNSSVPATYARPTVSDAHMVIAWACAVLTLGYLLPWAIAATRHKSNAGPIGLLNFLLGWSLVGWIVSLVMACSADPMAVVTTTVQVNAFNTAQPPAGWYPDATGIRRYWDGAAWTAHTI